MKASKDPGTMKFSRATISDFSYESAYEVLSNVCCFVFLSICDMQELLSSHPLLMHVIVASMTKDGIESIQVV